MHYDFVIIGAGCSGLSLTYHLLKSDFKNARILLIDKFIKNQKDKTWCFWSTETPEYKSAQKLYWHRMYFASDNYQKVKDISPYTYYYIDSIDFYKEVFDLIEIFPNVDFLKEEVLEVLEEDDLVEIKTRKQSFRAGKVYDSRIELPSSMDSYLNLYQNFYGWNIETEVDFFHNDTFTMMDFRIPNDGICRFMYVLPYNNHQALIEYTEFSSSKQLRKDYPKIIDNYIKEVLKIHHYKITSSEEGKIPMTNYPFPPKISDKIIKIGIAGGDTKPTTGYTFYNIQNRCKKLIQELHGGVTYEQSNKQRFQFYDELLLIIIKHYPSKVKRIMEYLFRKNEYNNILKFLGEDTTLIDDILLLTKLPWGPFMEALIIKIKGYENMGKNSDSTVYNTVKHSIKY